MSEVVELEWERAEVGGTIEVANGRLLDVTSVGGCDVERDGARFSVTGAGAARVRLSVEALDRTAAERVVVTVATDAGTFSFLPRDVSEQFPVLLAEHGVAVFREGSSWTLEALRHDLRDRAAKTKLAQVEAEPEASFDEAAARTRDFPCETVLGLGRDYRLFSVGTDLETVVPSFGLRVRLDPFVIPIGRGIGPRTDIGRRLDEGILQILCATKVDDDVSYELIAFATLGERELCDENVDGTDFRIVDLTIGEDRTLEERHDVIRRATARQSPEDAPVLIYRLSATNTSHAPRRAFFYTPRLQREKLELPAQAGLDGTLLIEQRIVGAARLADGAPLTVQQAAILLLPGESAVCEYRLLHTPWPLDRAPDIFRRSFEAALGEARTYWRSKLEGSARLCVPEQRIDRLARAGHLHLDLITYGRRGETLTPTVGRYTAIGTESAPIVQFFDSMGRHDIARRAIQYFLDKQRDDGFMQNYDGYMAETGAVLWTMGEHFRYTRDTDWVGDVRGNIERACEWIVERRHRDSPESIGPGSGLIVGKVADPIDEYRSFMLNAYHYLGLARAAEMLGTVDGALAERYRDESARYREDIRRALEWSIARSPVVPVGDGRYLPSWAPWAEGRGFNAFGLDGDASYTHGSVYVKDSLLGPLYAVFAGVVELGEPLADALLETHYEYMTQEGIALSQPYYSPHPLLHLLRGEIKPFLRAFYSGIASLADRETYTFWEHLDGVSPHKTHEEAWALMQLRHMLYTELSDDTLQFLRGVPRAYLADGNLLTIENARSHFGSVTLTVESRVGEGTIRAAVATPHAADRGLRRVGVRLPHPDGKRATAVDGGSYDEAAETVWLSDGSTQVQLEFE